MLNSYTSADSLYDILFNEGMEHVVSEGYDDLTETELSQMRELFDSNFDIGALGRYIAEEYLLGYADDIIEKRTRVYNVVFKYTMYKTLQIRAHSEEKIEEALVNGWNFTETICEDIANDPGNDNLEIDYISESGKYETEDYNLEELE